MLKSHALLTLFVLLISHASPTLAEGNSSQKESLFSPAFSAGLSYPLFASLSVGVLVPVTLKSDGLFPTVPALRADVELGFGGGSVAAGMFFRIDSDKAISIKAARLRTWLWSFDEEVDTTFDGMVGEFVRLSAHGGGPKLGIGTFRESTSINKPRDAFISLFLGIGW